MDNRTYFRIQVKYSGKTGKPVGIFGACHHLQRANQFSVDEKNLFASIDKWFDENLPQPAFYAKGNQEKAITWFKSGTTEHMMEKLKPLMVLLSKHGVDYEMVESNNPGTIIYEDAYQVAVI